MIIEENGVWTVPLGQTHEPYPFVRVHRRFAGLSGFTVVIVDTQKFLRLFENDFGFVIPHASTWDEKHLAFHRDRLSPHSIYGSSFEMPIATLMVRRIVRSRFFGLFKDELQQMVVSFTNGRHRARYMEYAGAIAFPVEVEACSAAMMFEHCGWQGGGAYD